MMQNSIRWRKHVLFCIFAAYNDNYVYSHHFSGRSDYRHFHSYNIYHNRSRCNVRIPYSISIFWQSNLSLSTAPLSHQ